MTEEPGQRAAQGDQVPFLAEDAQVEAVGPGAVEGEGRDGVGVVGAGEAGDHFAAGFAVAVAVAGVDVAAGPSAAVVGGVEDDGAVVGGRIEAVGPEMCEAVLARSAGEYRKLTDGIARTLARIERGLLQGLFDGPTSTPADLGCPAVSLDIHALDNAADDIVAAALLCVWAYGFGAIDAARAIGDARPYLTIQDELWRSLRAAPGLVERTDRLTRLNRHRGIGSIITTHGLADLEALPTAEDQAKAKGLIERSAITVLGALPDLELARVHQVRALTTREREMVAGWSAPESWETDRPHPGRGRYLIKNAGRLGIPVEMHLTPAERELYNTDTAITAITAVAPQRNGLEGGRSLVHAPRTG